jgi:hypothetical protein
MHLLDPFSLGEKGSKGSYTTATKKRNPSWFGQRYGGVARKHYQPDEGVCASHATNPKMPNHCPARTSRT